MMSLDKKKITQGLFSVYPLIEVFDCVDSTNETIQQNEYFYPNTLILSKDQGKGKGTNGRSFYCEKDKGIYASCVVNTEKATHSPTLLPIVMGLSLVRVLKNHNIHANVKWVNDVIIDNKKVAGILCEQSYNQPLMVVGIGINVYSMNFPDEIIQHVTSLQQHTDETMDINQIVIDLFVEFNKNLLVESQYIIDGYCKVNELINKPISFVYKHEILEGIVKTINLQGELVISHNRINYTIVSVNQIIMVDYMNP